MFKISADTNTFWGMTSISQMYKCKKIEIHVKELKCLWDIGNGIGKY
jgi:hypothetical protein